jgi:hypothetical protein
MVMSKKRISFFVFVFVQLAFSQNIERQILKGKVVADSLEVQSITVFNISSNIGSITDEFGTFYIKAKEKDTLFFQGLSFVSQKYILTKKDFYSEELEIKLNVKINELNEVIVSPYTLTGILEKDMHKIKVYDLFGSVDMNVIKYYEDDKNYKAPKITTAPDHFAPGGSTFDFKAIGKGIGKLLGIKGNPKKNVLAVMEERKLHDVQSKSFAEHIKERFSNHFFVSTLKIKNESIASFLAFAEVSSFELVELLKVENELRLIEYLILKGNEFKKEIPEESISLPNEK